MVINFSYPRNSLQVLGAIFHEHVAPLHLLMEFANILAIAYTHSRLTFAQLLIHQILALHFAHLYCVVHRFLLGTGHQWRGSQELLMKLLPIV